MRAGTGLVVVLRCRICRSPARRPVPATSSSPSLLCRAATTAQMPARRLSAVESSTLLQALEAVPDPRQRRGRRHPLHSMLYLALGRGAGWTRTRARRRWHRTPGALMRQLWLTNCREVLPRLHVAACAIDPATHAI